MRQGGLRCEKGAVAYGSAVVRSEVEGGGGRGGGTWLVCGGEGGHVVRSEVDGGGGRGGGTWLVCGGEGGHLLCEGRYLLLLLPLSHHHDNHTESLP